MNNEVISMEASTEFEPMAFDRVDGRMLYQLSCEALLGAGQL